MRVLEHPILPRQNGKKITIFFNDQPIEAIEGEPVAAALINAGIKVFRRTPKHNRPRGLFCAIGRCTDCMMTINGRPNMRTCITRAEDNMRVELQQGMGDWSEVK